ncbi:acyltransferase [Niabella drilacis]|uniref:Acetyltransferase (Isoleucine patch superfamily) n=1 Tax=Niabella drilacis (strain DSM 25811 / CCM 8410 / CCUG 62505 / LMG 26954 / E90) TaxID=1285928 RepID=A0A1G6QTS8_NIADE|nr:acyltransferase [Niabella drilacis]SDC95849.1 Acetyltransferase (isoleucine patch superfamily) [Niabella drilacis]
MTGFVKKNIKFLKKKAIWFYIKYRHAPVLGKGVIFNGKPIIYKIPGGHIKIGDHTLINSSNKVYHANMFTRSKIIVDRLNGTIEIGSNCRIHGTCIHAFKKIRIGNNCLIAANTQILDANGHALCYDNPAARLTTSDEGKEIIIEDNVWIGLGCIILGGSHIGEGSIISAGSVVKGPVEKNAIYSGNPAVLIKKF